MFSFKKLICLLPVCLLFIFLSTKASAHVSVEFSFAPAVVETYAPPARYVDCYIAPAGIYDGIWVNAHRVCYYNHAPRYWHTDYVEYDMPYYHHYHDYHCHHCHHHW